MTDNGATVGAATMGNGQCGKRTECNACNGTGCDHCGDVGTVACPCATGDYVHGTAERGECCAECGASFPTGGDMLRVARVPAAGGPAYLYQRNGWHTTCR